MTGDKRARAARKGRVTVHEETRPAGQPVLTPTTGPQATLCGPQRALTTVAGDHIDPDLRTTLDCVAIMNKSRRQTGH